MNELKRVHILQKIKGREMTAKQGTLMFQGAEALGLSLRHMRRLIARFGNGEPD